MNSTTVAIYVTTFLVGLVVSIYWYYRRKYSYWKNLGISSAPTHPIIGSMLPVVKDTVHLVELERYRKYGRVYGYYEGPNPCLSIADPEIIKNIILKDFQYFMSRREFHSGDKTVDNMLSLLTGEKWRRVRNIVTPAFTTGKIRKMTSIILDSAKVLSQQLDESAESKVALDIKKSMGTFTMDVIASTAFGTKIDSHGDPKNDFAVQAKKIFSTNGSWLFLLSFFFPKVLMLIQIISRMDNPLDFFRNVTHQIMEERKKLQQEPNDFLQLLMDAKDETREDRSQKSLSEDELIAQCVLFFIAGFDTTSSTLSHVCYELALNPSIQEKLITEIDNVVKENQNQVTYEAIQNMKYMDQIIWETLRIYSPALRIERMANEDYELGLQGLTIPKGMMVSFPVYAMHHDPEFFPDPEKFDPSRFDVEEKAKRNPYTYLPFGAGPRNCVGMRFALMKVKVCLAYILSLYRFRKAPGTKVPLEFFGSQGLLVPKEVLLNVEIRKDRVLKE